MNQENEFWRADIPIPTVCPKCDSIRTKLTFETKLFGFIECLRCFSVIRNLARKSVYDKYQINSKYKHFWKGSIADPNFDGYFDE